MKILIACEYSGIVRDAFTKKGHDVISCDILDSKTPGKHYQGNVLNIINNGFDLMIAHPPCQYLSYAGKSYWDRPGRKEKREEAINFIKLLYNAPIEKIAIENPIGHAMSWKPYDQLIRPTQFGDTEQKNVCLWLKNLPPLISTYYCLPKIYAIKKNGQKMYRTEYLGGKKSKERAEFFHGIASAMAQQWSE